jgi:hypothetical protein
MKKGKIIRKYKDKCLNCKKSITVTVREISIKGFKGKDMGVANFYCSKKCEKEFKKKLDKAIVFSEGYENGLEDAIKKLRFNLKEIKEHAKEIKHPDRSYHQGSIDILEIMLKSLADVKSGRIKRVV